ncbi:nuclear transport factor 2 family protein [Glaciimonas sp. PAMC28666]|uniref:YybH family protein n=1 Tax=Glaciimonas sp. PAMC28666 TaxID=2807626 RepID=UPI00196509B2|nr:nuclear transport factor 2 family protein [Glaciimonas sp. PAMC28666]QRX83741.1 nuclear transport factor 2 family protein [Glaciimonas sp. PAMC28666]
MPRAKLIHGTADDTETAFYDALSRADIDAMMALWADDEEIVCVHPGAPRLIGHAAIRAAYETLFARGGVHIRTRQVHVSHNMSTSIHNLVEDINRSGEQSQEMHILTTNAYMKTPRGWRIVLHHASIAPGQAPEDIMAANLLH